MATDMDTITITDITSMIASYRPRHRVDEWGDSYVSGLYVRWSTDPAGDCERGASRNWATGQSEMGLSACELDYTQTWHGLDTGRTISERVREYCWIGLTGGRPWVVEGYRPEDPGLMRGGDNEPLLRWPRAIAWIDLT